MGVVYRAQDLTLNRPVALKFLPPDFAADPETRERFVIEAQAAAALSHPNICTIYEVGEADELSYIAMEFVEGQSLKEKVKKGPLKVEDATDIAVQVANGLGEAHRKGIIHRDIKSANIMVTDKGQAKIMDFGLAKLRGGTSLTKAQTTLGTVAYMSPEQSRGEAVDGRTDLWSLGVVLYEMLTAELPFKGDRDASVIYSIVHEEPKSLKLARPPVPEDLQKVIARALKKSREARYGSAEDIVRDLMAYQRSVQLTASGVFNLKTLVRHARRPRVALPIIIGLAALAFFGGRFFKHQAQVRWARRVALPEIERIVANNDVWRNLTRAYALAARVEAVIPGDPKLTEVFSKVSLKINIKTEPPGARVSIKEYDAPNSGWKLLGVTPLERIRLPVGIFRWKVEKEGYETVLATASTWDVDVSTHDILIPNDFVRVLDKKGSLPHDMVRVRGAKVASGELADFFIDQYEVTNRQYREFISKGGYRDQKYWKEKIIKNGKKLTWEEGIKGFADQTGQPGPSTWQAGDYPEGQADYPVSGVSWYEAAAYAEFAGKSLPTAYHWGLAMGEDTTLIKWPQLGGFATFASFSNFSGKGPVPVGSLPGITSYGAFDMAGNVREWCWNETPEGRVVRGGGWDDNTYMFTDMSQAPSFDRSAKNGFRCALYPDRSKIPAAAFKPITLANALDLSRINPVPDSVFQVYKEQYSYDTRDLKARVESRKDNAGGWTEEKITFDAAYGGERVIAHLFLPENAPPPYQVVIYFPGSASEYQRSSEDLESYYEYPMFLSYLVKSGRAVVYPVYKGTFERGDADTCAVLDTQWNSHRYTEIFIQEVKDLKKTIDYLETRQDIDSGKLAYYGMSWGGLLGAIIPAIEDRLKASVLIGAGFGLMGIDARPEVNQINYVTRVKTPTLIINGRYDGYFVPDNAKRMFDLLGTPADKKRLVFFETDHIAPRNEYIKETLAWLDKYLGPVKR
jgi:dienelactone hydrolase/predicted Ser/Thr protein kinase